MRLFPTLLLTGALAAGCQTPATTDAPADSTAQAGGAMDHAAMGHEMMGTSSYTDVRFLDRMTPHHQMAFSMAQTAVQKAQNPAVRAMAEEIVAEQQPEIDSMQAWRRAWFPNTPAPGPMTADDMAMMGMGMNMDSLQAPTGAAYDRRFLMDMIPHHAGAITMAAEAQLHTERPEIRRIAAEITRSQANEIGRMQALLEAMR